MFINPRQCTTDFHMNFWHHSTWAIARWWPRENHVDCRTFVDRCNKNKSPIALYDKWAPWIALTCIAIFHVRSLNQNCTWILIPFEWRIFFFPEMITSEYCILWRKCKGYHFSASDQGTNFPFAILSILACCNPDITILSVASINTHWFTNLILLLIFTTSSFFKSRYLSH